mgnify:CR=1 FL=1
MRKEIENKVEAAIEEIIKINKKASELEKKAVDLELTAGNREVEKRINDFQKDLVIDDFDELNLKVYQKKQDFIKSLTPEQQRLYDEAEALATLQNKIASGMKQR